jgi:glycosyl transferase family 87
METSRKIFTAYLIVLAAAGLVLYFHLFGLLQSGRLFPIPIGGQIYFSDFVSFYGASTLAHQSLADGQSIYDPQVQADAIAKVVAPQVPSTGINLVYYPPFFYTLTSPLAYVGMTQAWMIWCLLGLVCLLWSFQFLLRDAPISKIAKAVIVVGALVAYPTWFSFRIGQTSLFLLPASIAAWCFLRNGIPLKSGCATGLGLIKVQYAPIMVLIGTVIGKARYLAGFGAVCAVLFAISLIIPGWSSWTHYPAALHHAETNAASGMSEYDMQTFRGEVLLLTHNSTFARQISLAAFGLTTLAILLLWIRTFPSLKRREPMAFELCASLSALAILTMSLHAHVQDCMLLFLPCVWLSMWSLGGRPRSTMPWLSGLLSCSIILFPFFSWVLRFFSERLKHDFHLQPFFAWAIWIEILAIVAIWKISRSEPVAGS